MINFQYKFLPHIVHDDSIGKLTGKILLFVLWIIAVKILGKIFFILSLIVSIFINLSSRVDGYSAYSVFNPQLRHLLGDLRADQVDQEMRGGFTLQANNNEDEPFVDLPEVEMAKHISRRANKPCDCGSGKKFKRCCAVFLRNTRSLPAEGESL
ncbi:hypothetical protein IE077_002209 [Cardiosporidium cionae]|uniref:SAYSvFN domain-containing protein n=1 Tax=Cardiosporidium cionae TaxID=476202 RepID=A0ABQ7JBJ7_9APIC|nr:hypothetical protein IE077_002209 [Cardiosporidium cionae]|eukprot:KAF8821279.1 hypothetical protein IE077_002209 [Cardiosporidium cionae]